VHLRTSARPSGSGTPRPQPALRLETMSRAAGSNPRPGLRRRRRRPDLRPQGCPRRSGDRVGHDRGDARAGPAQRRRGRGAQRRVPAGLPRGHPTARRLRRRGDLQLCPQPRRRQVRGARRSSQGAAPRWASGVLRRHRRRGHGRDHESRHDRVDRMHRRALTQIEFTTALTAAGFSDIEIRPTHRVHTHAQAAIIRASHAGPKSTPKGTPMTTVEVFGPAAASRGWWTPPRPGTCSSPAKAGSARRPLPARPQSASPRRAARCCW
jgi:hypothetical protein